tara:strand:- start:497 stop:1762 length:1266 start_codon:yes stop_codon:yes gene_type:complete
MKKLFFFLLPLFIFSQKNKPFITTKSPVTLFSTQDGETEAIWSFSNVNPYDNILRSEDSFTVIHLTPNEPPQVKTVYGTIASTILGTPSMAMSKDGRYGLVANHSWRGEGFFKNLTYPVNKPLLNSDLTTDDIKKQKLSPQLSDMISVVDLYDSNHPVVDRLLLDDKPVHILSHPDGKRYFAIGHDNFFSFKLIDGKLTLLKKSKIPFGQGCFWIHPSGEYILASRTKDWYKHPTVAQWYKIDGDKVKYLHDLEIEDGLDTEYKLEGGILRITPDGKRGFICQRTVYNGLDLADILIADLSLKTPKITSVIKQVGDGLESFAFHPNGKMAVATCLEKTKNSLAVLDISDKTAKVLYYLDAAGGSQGVEFTPEGDKLFLGSPAHGRIEVYDVVGDFELVKNQKFLKIGYGHNSLTIGKKYQP